MSRWGGTSQVWQVLSQARSQTANRSETGRNGQGSFRPVATSLISPSTTNLLDPASISTVSHSIPICSSVLTSLLSPHPSLRLHAELASVPLCLFSVWPGPFSSVVFTDLPACILRKSVSYTSSPPSVFHTTDDARTSPGKIQRGSRIIWFSEKPENVLKISSWIGYWKWKISVKAVKVQEISGNSLFQKEM